MKEVQFMSQKPKLKNLDPLIKRELDRTAKLDEQGRVLDGNGNPVEGGGAIEAELTLKGSDSEHSHTLMHYKLPDEAVEIAKIEREGNDFTIFEITAPTSSITGQREATLTLMRNQDPDTLSPEFLDLYNMNYDDAKQYGIRVQSRGNGELRDFVFEFSNGRTIEEAMRIKPDKDVQFNNNLRLMSSLDQILDFIDSSGARRGYIGSIAETDNKKIVVLNRIGANSIELFDNGEIVFYSESGDINFYTDAGVVQINGDEVETTIGSSQKSNKALEDSKEYTNTHASNKNIHRNITISNQEPSGGSDGDIWLKYE